MKIYERNGITYRLLKYGEPHLPTDLVAYRNCIMRDPNWVLASLAIRSPNFDPKLIPKNFAFLREADPLIAAMIKAKRKSKK